jgi:hypothetical protein
LLISQTAEILMYEDDETFLALWKWRIFNNLDEGINCVYCTGVWFAVILVIPFYLALFFPVWSLLLVILGGAGIQHYLTNK